MTLLNDDEWSEWSDREIARKCEVHHSTVSKYRNESLAKTDSEATHTRAYTDKHGNVSVMNTGNIGKRDIFGKNAEGRQEVLISNKPKNYL